MPERYAGGRVEGQRYRAVQAEVLIVQSGTFVRREEVVQIGASRRRSSLARQGLNHSHSIVPGYDNALIYRHNFFSARQETDSPIRQKFGRLISKANFDDPRFARFQRRSVSISRFSGSSARAASPGWPKKDRQRWRTGSTLLNEQGLNNDWIEKCLAHEDGCSSRGVRNKAEYEVQRRHMMQEWSNIVDAWVAGQKYVPDLIPPSMPPLQLDPALSPAESAVA